MVYKTIAKVASSRIRDSNPINDSFFQYCVLFLIELLVVPGVPAEKISKNKEKTRFFPFFTDISVILVARLFSCGLNGQK